jgi:hypothetical protein
MAEAGQESAAGRPACARTLRAAAAVPSGSSSASGPGREEATFPLPQSSRRLWVAALAFVLVGFLAITTFDGGSRQGVPTLAEVAGESLIPTRRTLVERTAFLNWQAMGLLLAGLSLGLMVVSVRSLGSVRASRPGIPLTVLTSVCGVSLAVLVAVGFTVRPGEVTVLREIEQYLTDTGNLAWASSGLGSLTFLPMRLGVVASILVATAMLALLLHPERVRPDVFTERMQRLRLLLYVTAMTLAAGVLATRAGYLWLLAFLVEDPKDTFWVQAGSLIQAASLRVGVLYSLYLALLYLPVHWFLLRQWESIGASGSWAPAVVRPGSGSAGEPLARGWLDTLAQFVALVAPAVTGAASNLIALKPG